MARSAFDDNVPRVRPRIRLGRVAEETVENATEPPPVAPREPIVARHAEPEPPPPVVEAPAAPPAPVLPPVVEARAEPAPEAPTPEAPAVVAPPPEPEPAPVVEAAKPAPAPAPVIEAAKLSPPPAVAQTPAPAAQPAEEMKRPAAVRPQPIDPETTERRSDLRRRAAGLSVGPAPVASSSIGILDDVDAVEATAELAIAMERSLGLAEEANIQLRRDLSIAMDDLARSTADSKRHQERADRMESEARQRTNVMQDLTRELELLEGERDSALSQASDGALALEDLYEKLAIGDRRVAELERTLSDALARSRRLEESLQAHVAQRSALRAELDSLRGERDTMVTRIAELEREREELTRSRRALDEVHRALSEARTRAQRIRPR